VVDSSTAVATIYVWRKLDSVSKFTVVHMDMLVISFQVRHAVSRNEIRQQKFLSTIHTNPPRSHIQGCYVHIYFLYKKFRRSPFWQNETQILYTSRRQISCLGSLQVGALNIWKCVHILFYRSVCGPTLHQLKQDSAALRLKFTRMDQNIVTHIYMALHSSTTPFPSLIFSISDTHKHAQWLPYGFFFLIQK
jgi:hypothetical protein